MNLKSLKNTLIINENDVNVDINFPQYGGNIDIQDNSTAFNLFSDIKVTVTNTEETISILFINQLAHATGIIIQLQNFSSLSGSGNNYSGKIGNTVFSIELLHINNAVLKGNLLCFSLLNYEAKITVTKDNVELSIPLTLESPVSALSVTASPVVIDVLAGRRAPEFSLGLYDDVNYTIPRPIRYGVPVISTVPAEPLAGASALSGSDAAYYATGLGPVERIVYFRAICNQQLPVPSVELMVYMPLGVDTVSEATVFTLFTSNWANTTNSVGYDFRGSSILPNGHSLFTVENTVTSVDGICYLNVYVPLYVQVSLPLKMEINING